jgi:hypothetical protein
MFDGEFVGCMCAKVLTWLHDGCQAKAWHRNPSTLLDNNNDCYRYDNITEEDLQVLETHYGYPAYHPRTFKVWHIRLVQSSLTTQLSPLYDIERSVTLPLKWPVPLRCPNTMNQQLHSTL